MNHSVCRLPAVALAGWLSLIAQARAEYLSSDADPPVNRTLQSPLWDIPPGAATGAATATIAFATPTPLCFGPHPSGPKYRVNPSCAVLPPPPVPPTNGGGSGSGPPGPVTPAAAPEPSSLALTMLGAVGLVCFWRKRRA
jgi:hypothetical protein